MKIYPQAQTPRKSSKLKPLTAEDKAYNHALSKERSKVENIFAKVKTPLEIMKKGLGLLRKILYLT
ncbi:transposase-like protein, IS1381 ISSpn7 [Streptococcus pneumoniae]|nr:transposase-like protein, IS1381 ISSpn7 [Streptococcus pneumoniae]